jgi:PAS domain-containing protein
MASSLGARLKGSGGFAIGVWTRAIVIGALGFAAVAAGAHHLYATALVAAGAAALVGLDLARSADAADRILAQFVDGLMAEGAERPVAPAGVRRMGDAIERAMIRLGAARAQRQRRIDFAEALADGVVAALLVVDRAGAVVQANRAARRLLGDAAGRLDRLHALGDKAAARLAALEPGARAIVPLADGRSVLASMAGFTVPGGEPLRLIALQSVAGDLDAVVLKAWEDLVRVLAHEMMNSLTPICSLSESIAGQLRRPAAGAGGFGRGRRGHRPPQRRPDELCRTLPPAGRSAGAGSGAHADGGLRRRSRSADVAADARRRGRLRQHGETPRTDLGR